MKKVISVLLAVLMILSVVPMGMVSFAEVNEYPYRNSSKVYEKSENGFYVRTDVDYIAWKVNTFSDVKLNYRYEGLDWEIPANWDENAKALGFKVDKTPAVGAVAYLDADKNGSGVDGAVAWVRAFMPDGRICIETYSFGLSDREYYYNVVSPDWVTGFIHFKDLDVHNTPRNSFEVTAKPGRYAIENVASGLVMTYGGECNGLEYKPMILSSLVESKAQLFFIRHSMAGKYFIEITHEDGGVVNIWRDAKETAQVGDPVTAFPKSNTDQLQQFYFTPVSDDMYIIQSYTDNQKVISATSKNADSQLSIADYNPKDEKIFWRLIPYKDYSVSFDANKGSCSTQKITVSYHAEYGELPVATRPGYTFIGWYTEKEGGTQITEKTIYNLDDNQVLYAHWFYENHMDINGDDKCDDCGVAANTFCDCFCHKTGSLQKLIYKIILLFWKLLNVVDNQYCPCGKQHWETAKPIVKV